jgi:hypothetical protein
MVLAAALLSLVLTQEPPRPPSAPTGVVSGVVLGAHDPGRIPLADAMVEWAGEQRRSALTDVSGAYRLERLPAGRGRLRVVHAGYEVLELEVVVPPGGTLVLDVELRRQPVMLSPLEVLVGPSFQVPAPDSARGVAGAEVSQASLRAVEAGTGLAEAGLGQATRALPPGEGENPEPRNVLFMRGSSTELKLVLLDGAPVYTPFHVGGLIQSFDPGTLGGADLFVGGAPARYDGGLSYVLDLRSREPRRDAWGGSASLDVMSVRGSLEGPLGERAGVLVGSRALHRGGEALLGQGRSPYGYADALVRLDLAPTTAQALRFTGFWNRESVYLDFPGAAFMAPTVALPSAARWGNGVVALNWSATRGTTRVEVQGSYSSYGAELPLHARDPVLADGTTRRARLGGEIGVDQWGGRVRYGAALDRTRMEFGARRILRPGLPGYEEFGTATVVGGYVDGGWPLARDLHFRGGVRLDRFSGDSGVRLAPRLALSWLLAPEARLTLAAGRYHQHARSEAAEEPVIRWSGLDATGALQPVNVETRLPVAGASHLVLSLDQQFAPGVRMGLEGFLKQFSTPGGEDQPLKSSGVDVRVHRSGERVSGWVGYSLSWFWGAAGDSISRSSFTGRHLLTAGVDGRMGDRGGINARMTFGDGLPYTSVPVTAEGLNPSSPDGFEVANGGSLGEGFGGPSPDAFLRLDAELYGVLTPRIGGRRTEMRPFLRLLNALDRRDALFYYFEPWRGDGLRPLAELAVLPVLGVEWRF